MSGQIADMDGIDERTIKNWQSLVQLFEKRTSMANKQQYLFNSKVSSMDIAKWLGKIGNESKQANTLMEHVSHAAVTSMPMTKVEQYVIHVNQSYQGQPADEQQLMEQLEKIMKSTDLRQLQNGKTELKISLRPQNLGDLTIRMNQVNGEMIVKISVHTSVAKEMIESNLHQLKHMFSPHQVAVEKQDMHILASQSANKEQSDQTFDEQQHSSKDAEDTFQAENDEEDDLKEQFADILLHAKV
ncbi:flagellar hook-length control protein FliK [Virgibacillus halophilus]|uniref:Flagellar hook-length control protein FliK n=1 Tax=Tigheibacillus halophilus TaxID=361280 RepID=A0ABU5CAL7_9BACI|nr:flagellar hook-length control protein FliK [Virgibacillus halophilus]